VHYSYCKSGLYHFSSEKDIDKYLHGKFLQIIYSSEKLSPDNHNPDLLD